MKLRGITDPLDFNSSLLYNSYMMIRKGDMNQVYKTKADLRTETSEALQDFLARGGQVQVVPAKKMRKRTTQKMCGKTTRNASTGTSGFAVGYSRSSFGA